MESAVSASDVVNFECFHQYNLAIGRLCLNSAKKLYQERFGSRSTVKLVPPDRIVSRPYCQPPGIGLLFSPAPETRTNQAVFLPASLRLCVYGRAEGGDTPEVQWGGNWRRAVYDLAQSSRAGFQFTQLGQAYSIRRK
ncbi:unnamed protein product [Protopolystoma xenopodis]|uniref:Uncharacterized protein n=1 Tax=Protopolystoma xenopodis TaxID=117903 RepID=A0A448XF34_9PLAT|nr:unnamed protein product [Protopolystoma xenopodis]